MLETSSTTWDEWRIVSIKGEFVLRYLAHVRKLLDQFAELDSPKVAFDLAETSYIDSSGITLILNYRKRLKARNGDVAVFGAKEEVKSVFSIVQLDTVITVFDTRNQFEETAGK